MCVAFANAKATHILSATIYSIYAIFNDQSFNDTLTNDIVSFEQLGPGVHISYAIRAVAGQPSLLITFCL